MSPTDHEEAIRDPFTGAYSRVWLDERLQEEVERARRYHTVFSLCLLDLDYFKSVNDAFGHTRGDQVLREFAQRLQTIIRSSDLLFRYGGDEFALLLPPKEQALTLARRVLDQIRSTQFAGDPPLLLSLSLGVASFPEDAQSPQALFEKADLRHYEAKRRGRGRVVGDDPSTQVVLPFEEISRLVERDEALQAVHRFLKRLRRTRRALLTISGPPGSGRSRLLAEVGRAACLQGYEVIALRGTLGLKTRAYGALAEACMEQKGLLSTLERADGFERSLQGLLEEKGASGLLFTVDDLHDLDQATLELLHRLLLSPQISHLALAHAADRESPHRLFLGDIPLREVVELGPLSREGLHVWVRSLLRWEPPGEFLDWLHQETRSLPAFLQQSLVFLVERGILQKHGEHGWTLGQEYSGIALGERLGLPKKPVRHNLPVLLTSFVGRKRELQQIKELLSQKRFVTLVGPGGIGKTRLALQVAADLLDEFEDGVWFIPLASIGDPTLVAATIAQALGVKEAGGQSPIESLKGYLREKQMLLVLDNFEQVVAAAPTVVELLAGAPHVRVLVTSREVVHVYGEHAFAVPPLALPSLKRLPPVAILGQYASVALFVERAQAVDADFTLTEENAGTVAAICARLDGLPLAVELAAARSKLLPPHTMLERLAGQVGSGGGQSSLRLFGSGGRDRPVHQQTLRGTIDWSYRLLDADEQRFFAGLAVFVGGWTLEAAEAVCEDGSVEPGDASSLPSPTSPRWGASPITILDGLQSLLDKSMVRQDKGADGEFRFTMLETIRAYALERLAESGEAERLRRRHAAYYLALAEAAEPRLTGSEQATWFDRVEAEHDNLRAALGWLLEQGTGEAGARLTAALWRFWYARGYLSEGRRWLEAALGERNATPDDLRAKVLYAAGVLAYAQGDYAAGGALQEESLTLRRALGDKAGIAQALNGLGVLAHEQGNHERAVRLLEESLALQRELGDRRSVAISVNNLGTLAYAQGDYERAETFYSESLELHRELGNKQNIAGTLGNLGLVALYQGNYSEAKAFSEESLALFTELGDRHDVASTVNNLGLVTLHQGDYAQAKTFFEESLTLHWELGDKRGLAYCLEGVAGLAWVQGQPVRAARLCGAAAVLRESIGAPLPPAERARHDCTVATASAQVGEAVWGTASEEGRRMSLEQAIAYAFDAAG